MEKIEVEDIRKGDLIWTEYADAVPVRAVEYVAGGDQDEYMFVGTGKTYYLLKREVVPGTIVRDTDYGGDEHIFVFAPRGEDDPNPWVRVREGIFQGNRYSPNDIEPGLRSGDYEVMHGAETMGG